MPPPTPRVAAALERMERRAHDMGIEDEPVDDDASVTAPTTDETMTDNVGPLAVEVVADGIGANGEAAGDSGLADDARWCPWSVGRRSSLRPQKTTVAMACPR